MIGTKERMAEVFKELVCKKSFHKITIRDITKDCQMTRENFYYHFRDKYDIMRWIFKHDVVEQLPDTGADFEDWLNEMITLVNRDYKFYRKVLKGLEYEQTRRDLYPIYEQRVHCWVREMLDDSIWTMRQEKEEFATRFFTDAFIGFFMNYMLENEESDTETMRINMEFLFRQFLGSKHGIQEQKVMSL